MKILVLGANGQVGSEVSQAFSSAPNPNKIVFEVVTADRRDLELSDLDTIGVFLHRVAPDFIVNAAAYTAVDKAETEQDLAVAINFNAVRAIALYCQQGAVPLLHISTDYVFDGSSKDLYSEKDGVGPTGVYGKSKLLGEQVVRELVPSHIILRTAWVFGRQGTNFVKTMLRLAKDNRELSIVADQVGSPTSAKAIAEAITNIVLQLVGAEVNDERWGTYHYSGLPYVSWADFADEIFNQAVQLGVITGKPKVNRISTTEYPTPARRPANSRLDSSKCSMIFGVTPDNWRQSLIHLLIQFKNTG